MWGPWGKMCLTAESTPSRNTGFHRNRGQGGTGLPRVTSLKHGAKEMGWTADGGHGQTPDSQRERGSEEEGPPGAQEDSCGWQVPTRATQRQAQGLCGAGSTWPRPLFWPPRLCPLTVPGSVSAASLRGHSLRPPPGPRSITYRQGTWKLLRWPCWAPPLSELRPLTLPSSVSQRKELLCAHDASPCPWTQSSEIGRAHV